MIHSELTILLSEQDNKTLTEYIVEHGYYNVQSIYDLINRNGLHGDDYTVFSDVDLIISIDLHTDTDIFIIEKAIYTRDQLIEQYKLNEFGIKPELLFINQKIEVIDDDYFIYDNENNNTDNNNVNNKQIYNTKIYIGKESWKDFVISFRFMRSISFLSKMNLAINNNDAEKNKESNYIDKLIHKF